MSLSSPIDIKEPVIQDGIEIHCAFKALISLSELQERLNPKNRNRHPPEQIDELVKQFKYQGIRHPVILSTQDGLMIAGEGRFLAAAKLGMTAFPVDWQEFKSADQQYAFGIADNAIQGWAELDIQAINVDLAELDGITFDIDRLAIKGFVLEPADKLQEFKEKELDENLITEKKCPSCGYEW